MKNRPFTGPGTYGFLMAALITILVTPLFVR